VEQWPRLVPDDLGNMWSVKCVDCVRKILEEEAHELRAENEVLQGEVDHLRDECRRLRDKLEDAATVVQRSTACMMRSGDHLRNTD